MLIEIIKSDDEIRPFSIACIGDRRVNDLDDILKPYLVSDSILLMASSSASILKYNPQHKKALSIDSNFTGAHNYIAISYLEMDDLISAKYHLDQLDLICLFGCEDFYDLKIKIAFYEKNNE